MSMAELLDQEEKFLRVLKPGDIVKGVVARKSPNEILIDVGAKSEGVVDPKDLSNLTPEELAEIREGEKVPVYVVSVEGEEDRINLSLSQARVERDWDEAERIFASGETVESTVVGNNKGGLLVNFGQIRGFVPGSLLINAQYGGPHRADRWNQMTGETLRLKIIEVDRERNRLILSERAVEDDIRQEKAKLLEELQEGSVRRGRVTSLANFGAFVDIGGIDGLIHLSELAWTRVSHPREVLKVGDEIEVYILNVDLEQQRVALSLKRLEPEPWSQVFDHYSIDQVVDAVITKLTDFGAFARLDDRIEGLIHISEISDKNITHPRDVLAEGQEIQVRIIHIDPERKRMGLSLKQVEGYEEWLSYKEEKEEQAEPAEEDESQVAETDEATLTDEDATAETPEA
ncbi:MAG: 30S ribosomal protein S1 [Anaerolineae bacterium]|nr:30S ribosomal protein S1 [Anaerolineae bacterium]